MSGPVLPPMMTALAVAGSADPFAHACGQARAGCDGGLVVHNLAADRMGAALVLAPEVTLRRAVAMLPACAVGLQNALGVLAPPEVAVQVEWSGVLRVNGGRCGGFRMAASGADPDAVPDWLVVGFTLPLVIASASPGETPDETCLYEEGCGDVEAAALLESWARHSLNWISRWESDGPRPLHAEWSGLVYGLGQPAAQAGLAGEFLGTDEDFGMLLRHGDTTHLIALTTLLEAA